MNLKKMQHKQKNFSFDFKGDNILTQEHIKTMYMYKLMKKLRNDEFDRI